MFKKRGIIPLHYSIEKIKTNNTNNHLPSNPYGSNNGPPSGTST